MKNINQKEIILAKNESSEGKDLPDNQMKIIIKEYEKYLLIPLKKHDKQILLCPVGLVGSGKSTIIKIISKKLDLLKISTDEIRELLRKKGFNHTKTSEIALILIQRYLYKKYSISLDADCIQPMVQKYVKKASKETGVIPIWIHIKTPEKQILARMKNNNLSKFFKFPNQAIENYKRRKPLHNKYLSQIKFYFKFNSSDKGINKQIDKFIKKIKEDILEN